MFWHITSTNHQSPFAQATHLSSILGTTGENKKEACGKLKGFDLHIGVELSKCDGGFPAAFEAAKSFCRGSSTGLRLRSSHASIEVYARAFVLFSRKPFFA